MTNKVNKSSENNQRIIYELDVTTIQKFAAHHLGRELTSQEIDRFESRFSDHLEFEYVFESACNCIDEILDV